MELNTKVETALGVEFSIAQNLREEIYAAIDELNKLTGPPSQVIGNQSNTRVAGNEGPVRIQMNMGATVVDVCSTTADMNNMSVDGKNVVSFADPNNEDYSHDTVQVDCFPHGRAVEPVQVPVAKLSYLNHADLLRKYSGI